MSVAEMVVRAKSGLENGSTKSINGAGRPRVKAIRRHDWLAVEPVRDLQCNMIPCLSAAADVQRRGHVILSRDAANTGSDQCIAMLRMRSAGMGQHDVGAKPASNLPTIRKKCQRLTAEPSQCPGPFVLHCASVIAHGGAAAALPPPSIVCCPGRGTHAKRVVLGSAAFT